jgi:hypothetical protein
MPKTIPIAAVPNQEFTVILDNNNWDVTLRQTNGVMSVSLILNGNQVIENVRAVAGMRLIPSQYEEAGNFVFITANFQMPDYILFNVSQSLLYASAAELAVVRTPTPSRITTAYFSPIAALPLRFSPAGYMQA